jgi:DNA-binding beta-propeller fold protein YncE
MLRQVGGQGWGDHQLDQPHGIWARNGIDVFVADYANHRIQRFDRNLNFVATLFTRDNEDPEKRFGYPTDIALSRLGELFICDGENNRVIKVNEFSKVERSFGGFDAGEGRLNSPQRIEIGPRDNVFVLDRSRIVVFDLFGNFLYTFGEGLFQKPSVIYADQQGLLVIDGNLLYSFDENGRGGRATEIATFVDGAFSGEDVLAMAFAGNALYFLTTSGVMTLPDAGVHSSQRGVDKDSKSR